jgi:hypothetical protein
VEGFNGAWLDLFLDRFIGVWSGMPQPCMPIFLASVVAPTSALRGARRRRSAGGCGTCRRGTAALGLSSATI